MSILDIIEKKRQKQELNKDEIEFFVNGYTEGKISDEQAAALIMAIYIQGMSKQETTYLTLAMAHSGEILDLSKLGKIVVDKHSTGGVGDKVSLILLPLVASCGVPVAKMSGRGLGFTGGTVDKLQSIPGYQTDLTIDKFVENVEKVGISMIAQTLNLAPADKKIYALRDSIACVDSIPLIASSIMSKKIASGAQKIVIDVTVGKGAFMKNIQMAEKLAEEMIGIGKLANKETVCVLTNMEEPLGHAVGNSLEIKEVVEALKGNIADDVKLVVLELGSYMLLLAKKVNTIKEAKELLMENLNNGKAYQKFIQMIENQGGDSSSLDYLEQAKYIETIYSNKEGYINEINAEEIGKLTCKLGAGRVKKEDNIDLSVGVVLEKKVGQFVKEGEILGYIHVNKLEQLEEAKESLINIIKIKPEKVNPYTTIIKVIK